LPHAGLGEPYDFQDIANRYQRYPTSPHPLKQEMK